MTTLLPLVLVSALSVLDGYADRVIANGGDASAEARLRDAGPAGLFVLLERRSVADRSNALIDAAIDRVAGQRYGSVSRLYWYTDLDAAKAESLKSGRPILSLRMLGKLTDELSCANSRFFRTVLYADPQVAAVMRDRFVLHWSSERDVPIITIDFGDGRVLRRTVTGNSAHYVLDENGRVLDVIPGLYSPAAFVDKLNFAATRPTAAIQARRAAKLEKLWAAELERIGLAPKTLARGSASAASAIPIAPTKSIVELPMVVPASELKKAMTDEAWDRWMKIGSKPVELSMQSLTLMRAENSLLDNRMFEAMIAGLKKSIARDTLQNDFMLHREILARLGDQERPAFEEMNAWIYSELFATPASDPWLGLHNDAIYTGLDNAGIQR